MIVAKQCAPGDRRRTGAVRYWAQTPPTRREHAHHPCSTRPSAILAVVLVATALFLAGLALVHPTAAAQSEPAPTTVPLRGEAAAQTAPAPAAGGPRVAFVGDSIGHSAEAQVRQALGDQYRLTSYDSVNGSTIADHRTAVARLLQSASRPEILVIELGTNDAERHGPRRFDRDLRASSPGVAPRRRGALVRPEGHPDRLLPGR